MFFNLTIPKTISDFNEVRLLEWHFSKGGHFEAGSLLLEIETQKAIIEVRTQQSGFLREIYIQEGEWISLEGSVPLALFSDQEFESLPDGGEQLTPIEVDILIV